MKQIIVEGNNDSRDMLEKSLLSFNYPKPVVVRLGVGAGGSQYKYPIQINKYDPLAYSLDRLYVKKTLSGLGLPSSRTYTTVEDIGYPFILKSRFRFANKPTVLYIENGTDYKMGKGILGGYYIEPVFVATSEYRLFCTRNEVFLTLKKINEDVDDIITTSRNSRNIRLVKENGSVFPKLWSKIQTSAFTLMKALDLDIASIDISYSSVDDHRFIIHEVNTNPLMPTNILTAYIDQLDKLIKEKL